jgi:hypothetical protein
MAALALATAAAPAPATGAIVTVDPAGPGPAVPPAFAGLSFEAADLPAVARGATQGNLVALLRSLGPGIIRFGGNSVDASTAFARDGRPPAAWATTTITPEDYSRLRSLLRRTGWRAIVSVGLAHFDPARAAAEVAAASHRLGSLLAAVEIGNEPNAFWFNRQRPPWWGYLQYREELRTYRRAIGAAAPGVALAGPDVTPDDGLRWLTAFAREERPALLTPHFYPLASCYGPRPTLPRLLGGRVAAAQDRAFTALAALGRAQRVPVRLGEMNNVACAGQPGVSDVHGAGLWAVRTLLAAQRAGLAGVNLHTLPDRCRSYTPLCTRTPADAAAGRFRARPEWYALLLLRRLTGSFRIPSRVVPAVGGLSVDAFADRARRRVDLVVVNTARRGTPAAVLRLRIPGLPAAATVLRLTAPGLRARSGVTLGGGAVRRDGTWRPAAAERLAMGRNGPRVTVPAGTAALVRVRVSAARAQRTFALRFRNGNSTK